MFLWSQPHCDRNLMKTPRPEFVPQPNPIRSQHNRHHRPGVLPAQSPISMFVSISILYFFLSLNYILNVTCSGAGGSSPEGRRSQVRTHQRVQDTLNDFMHDPSLRPLNIAAATDDPDNFMHSSATAYQPSMMSQRPAQQNRRKPQWVSKTPFISCRIRPLFTIYFRTVRPRNLHNADPNDRNPLHSNGAQQVNKYFFSSNY